MFATDSLRKAIHDVIARRAARIFKKYKIPLTDNQSFKDIAIISHDSKWHEDPIITAHATQLDCTQLYYILPDKYHAICKIRNKTFPAKLVNIGATQVVLLGFLEKQGFGPWIDEQLQKQLQWDDEQDQLLHINTQDGKPITDPELLATYRFLALIHKYHVKQHYHELIYAFHQALDRHRLHRKIVLAIQKTLNIPRQYGHDLSKDTIVTLAAGYNNHFQLQLKHPDVCKAAQHLVKISHLQKEPHYTLYKLGPVDWQQLFVDRIAKHLQYSEKPNFKEHGFDLGLTPCQPELWKQFREKYKHINLWKQLKDILPNINDDTDDEDYLNLDDTPPIYPQFADEFRTSTPTKTSYTCGCPLA